MTKNNKARNALSNLSSRLPLLKPLVTAVAIPVLAYATYESFKFIDYFSIPVPPKFTDKNHGFSELVNTVSHSKTVSSNTLVYLSSTDSSSATGVSPGTSSAVPVTGTNLLPDLPPEAAKHIDSAIQETLSRNSYYKAQESFRRVESNVQLADKIEMKSLCELKYLCTARKLARQVKQIFKDRNHCIQDCSYQLLGPLDVNNSKIQSCDTNCNQLQSRIESKVSYIKLQIKQFGNEYKFWKQAEKFTGFVSCVESLKGHTADSACECVDVIETPKCEGLNN